ncbi:MAG: hypothetical protein EBV77_01340 [Gemmatimonadaceae bacterium]|nr:hypothetical protein [Gemmatimonadaceae bacterium]
MSISSKEFPTMSSFVGTSNFLSGYQAPRNVAARRSTSGKSIKTILDFVKCRSNTSASPPNPLPARVVSAPMTAPASETLAPALMARVATELALNLQQVQRTLALFAEGATLPFIARYRKEMTGGLDEVQLRDVRERAEYLGEMEDRRAAIIKSIDEQGKLDDTLKTAIMAADTKQALEDL